ncbi:T9SS type A sorting domain-containing protein, partial [Candidatus Fermentibacteria bacterium]|nr:T9SS type A sorting domain-containing protein [Candidatus Fermentibacteria bacterium]
GYFERAFAVHAEDINGDGNMDVVGAAYDVDEITWWENDDGSGTSWIEHKIDSLFTEPYDVYSEDIDGDGNMDILGASNLLDEISWWKNENGSGTSWTKHIIDGSIDGPRSIHSEDIDGDGDMDVISASYYDYDLAWWENDDGSGTSWTKHLIDGNIDGSPSSVYGEDLDGDGDIDVLGTAYMADDDDVTWWENDDGSGTSWTKHMVDGQVTGSNSVYSEDINGDGKMDILAAASSSDQAFWWDLSGYAGGGELTSSVLDIQESPNWQDIDWNCAEPSGTSILFLVRASDDPGSMGAWSDTLTAPGSLSGIVSDQDDMFQYQAIMRTSNPDTTPTLRDVTISWEPYVGTEGKTGIEVQSYALHGALPNPAFGTALLSFALPADSRAELTVYDISGRVVSHTEDSYSAGTHQLEVSDLACGVYLIRMGAGEFTATSRFVVIE